MRQVFILIVLLVISAANGYSQDAGKAGKDPVDTLAPYQKYPTLPAFNVMEMDSVTIFNTYNIPKGRPVAIMLFSPDCGHCARMTDEILEKIDSLSGIDFYLVTPVHNMDDIRKFYEHHHHAEYSNVKMVGRDYEFFYGGYYKIAVVPDLALYDAQKKLVKLFQGETRVHFIYEALEQAKGQK